MSINVVSSTAATQAVIHTAATRSAHPPHAQPAAQATPAAKEPSESKPISASSTTVNISSAAKAALQEATETAAQTAVEANHGDLQAQRLLAKAGEKLHASPPVSP